MDGALCPGRGPTRNANAEFAPSLAKTVETGTDMREDEVLRPARDGRRTALYEGSVCGYVRKYLDALIIFLLRACRPKRYHDRRMIEQPADVVPHTPFHGQ